MRGRAGGCNDAQHRAKERGESGLDVNSRTHSGGDEDRAGHRAVQKLCVEVGFLEARCEPFAEFDCAARQQFRRKLELLRILGMRREDGVHIARIVGVELALDDGGRLAGFLHRW